jgi:hypothetical protein
MVRATQWGDPMTIGKLVLLTVLCILFARILVPLVLIALAFNR